MNLKTLISSLIESVFTSKKSFISNQAMPDDNLIVDIQQNTSGDITEFIAPYDGYAMVRASTKQTGSIGLGIYSGNEAYQTTMTVQSNTGQLNALLKPVSKGSVVRLHVYRANLNSISMKFISTIGGGYLSSILQAIGGGLCLISHSFNRFSSSAVAKRIRQAKESQSTCRQAVLLHHTMGISSSEQTLLMGKTLLSMLGGLFLCRLTVQKFVTHVLQYLVQKDKLFISAQVVLSTLRHSFRQKARLSFCEGGAL